MSSPAAVLCAGLQSAAPACPLCVLLCLLIGLELNVLTVWPAAPGCCYNVRFKPGCAGPAGAIHRTGHSTLSILQPTAECLLTRGSSPACPLCPHSVTSCNLVPPARLSFIVHPINLWWPRLGSARGEEAACQWAPGPCPAHFYIGQPAFCTAYSTLSSSSLHSSLGVM